MWDRDRRNPRACKIEIPAQSRKSVWPITDGRHRQYKKDHPMPKGQKAPRKPAAAKPTKEVVKKKPLSPEQRDELLGILKERFEKNMDRHKGLEWAEVQAKLEANAEKLWSLHEVESTGGEPDVVGHDEETDEYIFYDCSAESPVGRRNVCYDGEGQEEREKRGVYPEGNAFDMAAAMGIELPTGYQYRALQELGNFDTKTSNWVKTPADIRKLGGALFVDRRFGHVFLYHNTAPTFYGVRALLGSLRV
jgi:Protein of unknown function (DUF4256)